MKFRAIVLSLALAACGQTGAKGLEAPETPAAPDPFDLQIEIGRYSVMLHHVDELTGERPGVGDVAQDDPLVLARSLREVVYQYNLERSTLCEKQLFTEISCGPAFEPVWMSEPADAAPSLADLQTRSNAVGEEVMRFWDAVCDDAKSRAANEEDRQSTCAIE